MNELNDEQMLIHFRAAFNLALEEHHEHCPYLPPEMDHPSHVASLVGRNILIDTMLVEACLLRNEDDKLEDILTDILDQGNPTDPEPKKES